MQIYRLTEARSIFSVKDLESKDKSIVIITQQNEVDSEDGQVYDSITCTCRFHWSFQLYCSHIFSVLGLLQVKSINKFKPFAKRWSKEFQERTLPGLYSRDVRLNPEAYAGQFQLYNRQKELNNIYAPSDSQDQPPTGQQLAFPNNYMPPSRPQEVGNDHLMYSEHHAQAPQMFSRNTPFAPYDYEAQYEAPYE
jgi:hypothetical protein